MAAKRKIQFSNVDEYIDLQVEEIKPQLNKLRQTIKKAAPKALEVISYQMPGYKLNGILVWFAAFKNHYSIFARPDVLKNFKEELKKYSTTKSAVHFPFDKALPVQLVSKIVKEALRQDLEKGKIAKKKI